MSVHLPRPRTTYRQIPGAERNVIGRDQLTSEHEDKITTGSYFEANSTRKKHARYRNSRSHPNYLLSTQGTQLLLYMPQQNLA